MEADRTKERHKAGRPRRWDVWQGFARGLALFAGAFGLLNVLGELRYPGFDANLWWIDLRPMPPGSIRAFLAFASVLLVACAIRPKCGLSRGP
jgi:hypothetical protein